MTWTIEVTLVDMICRYIAGIGTIALLIMIIHEQRSHTKKSTEDMKNDKQT